jgi:hypothetical protein
VRTVSKKQIALIVLLALVIAIVAAVVVVNNKYAIITASPKISYETLLTDQTRAELVIDIPKLQGLIQSKLPPNIPPSVLPRVLPYSAALTINPDYSADKMDMKLFINDQRLAPVLLEQINNAKLPDPIGKFFPSPMEIKEPGKMLRSGEAPLDKDVVAAVKEAVKNKKGPDTQLKIEGGHLAEVAIDNRDGSLISIGGSFAKAMGAAVDDYINPGYFGMIAPLDNVRLQADIDGANLKIRLILECAPGTDPGQVNFLSMALDLGFPQLQASLNKNGIKVDGKCQTKDNVITGDYVISNYEKLLAGK